MSPIVNPPITVNLVMGEEIPEERAASVIQLHVMEALVGMGVEMAEPSNV